MRPVSLSRFHDLDAFLDRFAAFFSFGVMVGFFFASGLFLSSLGIVGAPYS
jgi:hypothetical protein